MIDFERWGPPESLAPTHKVRAGTETMSTIYRARRTILDLRADLAAERKRAEALVEALERIADWSPGIKSSEIARQALAHYKEQG